MIRWDDLRSRLLSFSGQRNISVATRAMEDSGRKITHYLIVQALYNGGVGLVVGLGLYFIGLPYAALWGLRAGSVSLDSRTLVRWSLQCCPSCTAWVFDRVDPGVYCDRFLHRDRTGQQQHHRALALRQPVGVVRTWRSHFSSHLDVSLGSRGIGAGNAAHRLPRRFG